MEVTDDLILKLENLAKLRLTSTERQKLKEELSKMIGMFSQISEVDTDDVLPLIHMTETYHNLRPDIATNTLTMEEVSDRAPLIRNNLFGVPKVIE